MPALPIIQTHRSPKVLDFSPANRAHELGLDRHETFVEHCDDNQLSIRYALNVTSSQLTAQFISTGCIAAKIGQLLRLDVAQQRAMEDASVDEPGKHLSVGFCFQLLMMALLVGHGPGFAVVLNHVFDGCVSPDNQGNMSKVLIPVDAPSNPT